VTVIKIKRGITDMILRNARFSRIVEVLDSSYGREKIDKNNYDLAWNGFWAYDITRRSKYVETIRGKNRYLVDGHGLDVVWR
jgi:hypothetical protein